ncbi:MAG: condensation domain-containing protein, partial [Candidatus Tectomicrobia bacterium]|nr:condensation domain-containing protein [Candidatus Tectomicrobia bacterium]
VPDRGGQPVQLIHPELSQPLKIADLQPLSASEQTAELDRLLIQDVKQPFDLAQGPLLRAHLYLLSETEQVLQLTIHHIISDAWSMDVFTNELSILYQAALTDQAVNDVILLPALPVQYADFAQWQREWLRGEVLETQLAYWQEQLAHTPTLLNLPTDHPRPPVQTFNGQIERFTLDEELIAPLSDLSRRLGTSLFMTYYAAFAVLMSRYSGQEDLVIGTPIANRHYREIEPLIGLFLNTLALRTDLSGDPGFADVLKHVRQVTLDAYAHQDIPFEQLVEELAVERHLSHAPLFQVMFVWFNQSPPVMLGNMKLERLPLPAVTAKFDLTLFLGYAEETGDSLRGMIEYNTDLFERATIERMIGHFRQLLHGIATSPQQPVKQLPLLTEAERQQIVLSWNETASAYPADLCLHQLFEQQVERTPNGIAVLAPPGLGEPPEQMTYAELNTHANQLAHHLRALGVGPDVLVGLSFERSVEMMVGVLAILKAGGAYVPLDPAYPQERLTFMQRDAHIKVLLTHSEQAGIAAQETQPLYLDQIREHVTVMPTDNPHSGVAPDNLAYVIYTSGSTGQPKGVAMPHRPLVNLMAWQLRESPAAEATRTLQFTPISFDVSCQELFSTWSSGGTLVLVDDDTRRDGEALLGYLNAQRIERLFLPFVALQQLAESAHRAPPPTLCEVITAGEQLQVTPAITAWFNQSDCTLHNQYGPTESHVITAYPLPKAVHQWARLPPIGRPIANA